MADAAIGTGIAVEKMLALTGQTPAAVNVNIANVRMPTAEEREEIDALDRKLDEFAKLLKDSSSTTG